MILKCKGLRLLARSNRQNPSQKKRLKSRNALDTEERLTDE